MVWLIFLVAIVAAVFLPNVWVKHVLKKYSKPADRYRSQGTGADLARHLLDRFDMPSVKVEETEQGDHYDPEVHAVRLSRDNFAGHSLTAITVAAHEVGHAIQHARGERLFRARQRLVKVAIWGQKLASMMLVVTPLLFLVTRAPQASALSLLIGVASMTLGRSCIL